MNKKLVIVGVVCIAIGTFIGYVIFQVASSSKNIEENIFNERLTGTVSDEVKATSAKKENSDISVKLNVNEAKNNKSISRYSDDFRAKQESSPVMQQKAEPDLSDGSNVASEIKTPVKDLAKSNRPLGMDKDHAPLSMLAQINGFITESKRTAGPNANQMGKQLLKSTNSLLRVAGAAVLAANDGLTDNILNQIAMDDNLSVSLNSMGWLSDTGYGVAAQSINKRLSERGLTKENLLDLIIDGELNSSGSRLALEMIAGDITLVEARDIYGSVGADVSMAYSVRMKALLELKKKLDFLEFRDTVNQMNNSASAEDAVWQEGVKRLAESLVGPVAALSGPSTVTPNSIDEALAREYPMTLEDLAQKLENVVSSNDSYVQEGTAKRLGDRLEELNNRPWSEEQQISLNRINAIIEQLKVKEKPLTEAPVNLSEPPPGAGD